MEWAWLLLLGLGTGAYGVLVGADGGIILVPMLLLFLQMEFQVVPGTSLALVAVNAFSGAVAYCRLGLVDVRSGLVFAAAAVPGSLVAPFVVENVGGTAFRLLFGLLLVGLATHMLFKSSSLSDAASEARPRASALTWMRAITTARGQTFHYQFNLPLAVALNLVLGFVSSFFGIGGSFLRTPILVTSFGFPVRVSVATSLFALSIYATLGAAVHAGLGNVDWYPTFVWAGIGLFLGAQIGARLSYRFRSTWVMRLLVLLLFVIGARLLVEVALG